MAAVIIPLGHRCITPLILRSLGWRTQSFPFDWCCSNIKQISIAIKSNLVDLVMADDISRATWREDAKHYYVYNQHGIEFPHLLNPGQPIGAQIPQVVSNVERRCSRLRDLLEGKRPLIFFAYYERGLEINYDDLLELSGILKSRYPSLPFRILAFEDRDVEPAVTKEFAEVVYYKGRCHLDGEVNDSIEAYRDGIHLLRTVFSRAFLELQVSEPTQVTLPPVEDDHDNKGERIAS
jgi:Putative papain-like cysteine peptidase (DUF1796)